MRAIGRMAARLTAILGLLACATGAAAESPEDLVGTWKGYRVVGTGKGRQERRDHSVTVKAVRQAEGKWEVDAVDGQGRPLPMAVSVADGRVRVEYTLADSGQSVRLELQRATVLRGETRGRGTGNSQDVRLEKQ